MNKSEKKLLSLISAALCKIEQDLNPIVIANILELKYLSYLGVTPYLDGCARCGRQDNIVSIKGFLPISLTCVNLTESSYSNSTLIELWEELFGPLEYIS